ncbi:MFS transporter [Streptomyces tubercidicus]|uniref:MFS transporter n=1 Tax=Streptomyces tubercidicus TaxID=47759 RepID=UPI0036AEA945
MFGRIWTLALGAFAVGTSGYIVTGVLPELGTELSVPMSTAGLLTTSFALSYAVGAPPLAVATSRWGRRPLIVGALLVAALGNAFAALAPDFALLLTARIVTAVGAAVFTPAATAVAAELSGAERRAKASALVFGGMTIATIVGVPTGSLLVGPLGYRGVFWLVAACCGLAAVAVAVAVPSVAPPAKVTLRQRLAVAADGRVLATLGITLAASLGVFTVYTYAAPVLSAAAGAAGGMLGMLLFGYGIGGAVGNVVGGVAADRFGYRAPLLLAVCGSVVMLSVLPVAGNPVAAGIVLILWGVSSWAFNPPVQRRVIELAPESSGLLLSLNASALYLGIGLSGVVGGAVIDHAGIGAVAPVGAGLCLVAVVLHVASSRRAGRVAERVNAV